MRPSRPQPGEYAPNYETYVSKAAGDDVLRVLAEQLVQFPKLFAGRRESDGDFRYAPGKWSIKEMIGHINDTERIFAYRALRIARDDQTPMEGFEQDDYVRAAPFARCPLINLLEEFTDVRRASLALFRPLDEAAWLRRGVANKNEVTVRAVAYIIAGHLRHHAALYEERYLPALPLR
jgi:hypothetical protein